MPFGINSNLSSLGVQRHLGRSRDEVGSAMGRLSSGLRINRAQDDAAGMAIAERMNARIRGDQQALRNTNDGISALQTAEGALVQMTANLQRIRELAVQAANETNTRSDRQALQIEVDQLMAANYQIGNDTEFNGQKILDGSFYGARIAAGSQAEQMVIVNIAAAVSRQSSGLVLQPVQFYQKVDTGTPVSGALLAGDLRINNIAIGASLAGDLLLGRSSASAWAMANAITSANVDSVESVSARTTVGGNTLTVGGAGRTLAGGALVINGLDVGAVSGANAADFGANIKAAIDGSGTGVTASFSVAGNNVSFTLVSADGGDVQIGGDGTIAANGLYKGNLTLTTFLDRQGPASFTVTGANPLKAGLAAGLHAADPVGAPVPTLVPTSAGGEPEVSLISTTGATGAIEYADSKLTFITGIRASIGASQNQLLSVIDNLAVGTQNLQAARSRIRDADYAMETAALTRAMILQRAGTAMLAQSNALPNTVLRLLRGI